MIMDQGNDRIASPARAPDFSRLAETLAGRRVALIGFESDEADRIRSALERVRAYSHVITGIASHPGLSPLARFDLCIVNASPGAGADAMRAVDRLVQSRMPGLLIASREELMEHALEVASAQHDFLVRPWEPEDLVLRVFRVARQGDASRAARERPSEQSIVIADDDATTVLLMTAMLKNSQIKCEVAKDGAQALRLARTSRPELILLDVMMPEMDGFEVLEALRRDPLTRDVPIVLLSACNSESDVVRGLSLGADDYIVKPFHPQEMLARVQRLLSIDPAAPRRSSSRSGP
jgi:DNA-binding response OmpR family regulator